MGGHRFGDYASASITEALSRTKLTDSLSECVDAVEDALLDVNLHLREHAKIHCEGNTVGSTVVVFLARGSVGVTLWAGDSRLYRLRRNRIEQITRDYNPISDLLDSGNVSEEEATTTDTHVVTRAVGGQRDLHLDVAVFDILPSDKILLCSDGLYREVPLEFMKEALLDDIDTASKKLMQGCLSGDARDNVSFVVAQAQATGLDDE
jgi:protein phosphatase